MRHSITRCAFSLCAVAIFTASLVFGTGSALAQGEPVLADMTAKVEFPGAITFDLAASAGSVITDIRLNYRVERDSYARVISEARPIFTPDVRVSVSWTWDLRQSGGLPPGSVVEYWWTVRDERGRSASSVLKKLTFADGRFEWQEASRDNLTMYWYSAGEDGARKLLEASLEGLGELEEKTGAYLVRPVRIYVYDGAEAMLGAMMFPQEWTGAAAYTDQSTILIGLSDDWEWNENTMVHELAHIISYQLTRGPYARMPVWLSEGFSMYAEGELGIYFASALTSALNDGTTITVRGLSGPFSADPARSFLAYAQSYSLMDYLAVTYGQERILEMLMVFACGAGYDEALQEIYGLDMDGLYSNWLEYAFIKYVGAVPA